MSFRSDANDLLAVLHSVVRALERFDGAQRNYTGDLAIRLQPLVSTLEHAVTQARSREAAVAALDHVKPLMAEISGAATKGEMQIFSENLLGRYHRFATIFQETRYAGHTL